MSVWTWVRRYCMMLRFSGTMIHCGCVKSCPCSGGSGLSCEEVSGEMLPQKAHPEKEIEEKEAPKRHQFLHPGGRDRMLTGLLFKLSAASTIQNYNLGKGNTKVNTD